MLVTIDQIKNNSVIDDFLSRMTERNLTFYATDLLDCEGCRSMDALGDAVRRATEVCNCMHLPLHENFKAVFRSKDGQVMQDWRLSPMAYMLLAINSDSSNQMVAQLQVELVKRALHQE